MVLEVLSVLVVLVVLVVHIKETEGTTKGGTICVTDPSVCPIKANV